MPPTSALASLEYQGILDGTVTQVYEAPAVVELSRASMTNFSGARQSVALYHRLKNDTDTPGNAEAVAMHSVDPYSTSVEPSQSTAAITLQPGDTLWAKADTISGVGSGGSFSPTLLGTSTFTLDSVRDFDDGDTLISIPSSTDYPWVMTQIKATGLQSYGTDTFLMSDFTGLTAATDGTTITDDNSLQTPSHRSGVFYLGRTSANRLLVARQETTVNATVKLWGFDTSDVVTQVSGITLSVYVIPQNTAPNSEIV